MTDHPRPNLRGPGLGALGVVLRGCIVLVALRLASLPLYPLMDRTDSRYGEVAREMVVTSEWVTPRLLGRPFRAKPPRAIWGRAAGIVALARNERAARLPAFLAGLLTVLLVGRIGRLFGGPAVARLSALVFCCSPLRLYRMGGVMTDPFLVLKTTRSHRHRPRSRAPVPAAARTRHGSRLRGAKILRPIPRRRSRMALDGRRSDVDAASLGDRAVVDVVPDPTNALLALALWGGAAPSIERTTDGGKTWVPLTPGFDPAWAAIDPAHPESLSVGGCSGALARSEDAGQDSVDLPITAAVAPHVKQTGHQADRTPDAERWNGESCTRVDMAGTLALTNSRDGPVHPEVTRSLLGRATRLSHEGDIRSVNAREEGGWSRWNAPVWWPWSSRPYAWEDFSTVRRVHGELDPDVGASIDLASAWRYDRRQPVSARGRWPRNRSGVGSGTKRIAHDGRGRVSDAPAGGTGMRHPRTALVLLLALVGLAACGGSAGDRGAPLLGGVQAGALAGRGWLGDGPVDVTGPSDHLHVVFFFRPGCPRCAALGRRLAILQDRMPGLVVVGATASTDVAAIESFRREQAREWPTVYGLETAVVRHYALQQPPRASA